jgi:hypothetical protein
MYGAVCGRIISEGVPLQPEILQELAVRLTSSFGGCCHAIIVALGQESQRYDFLNFLLLENFRQQRQFLERDGFSPNFWLELRVLDGGSNLLVVVTRKFQIIA